MTIDDLGNFPHLKQSPATKRQLLTAARGGRLNPIDARALGVEAGRFECPTCGMFSRTAKGAADCCAAMIESTERRWTKYEGETS